MIGPAVSQLFFDTTDREEGAYDAVLDQSPAYKNLRFRLLHTDTSNLPNEIWFWAALDRIRRLDLLMVQTGWKIISTRMLQTLEGLGDFPHATVPVNFKDARGGDETLEDQYVVLLITAATDALDLERSEIEYTSDGRILFIKKWVFKEPPQGLPPAFRIKENRGPLLLSGPAALALEQGIFKGIQIRPQHKIERL